MDNPTRRTVAVAAGAAALLAASVATAVAGTASEAPRQQPERITTAAQLQESIGTAVELERQYGAAEIGGSTGGQITDIEA
ncbi:hypothetical protein [Streptomyces sp. CC208A]|uniref:hypothetical protein n=1 Tax=Streptomyces sp. CC208A TaxID=3044573 RepID=UPI0024A7C848|nr:hypothetical protein [Streptomyces sp. CC208A]